MNERFTWIVISVCALGFVGGYNVSSVYNSGGFSTTEAFSFAGGIIGAVFAAGTAWIVADRQLAADEAAHERQRSEREADQERERVRRLAAARSILSMDASALTHYTEAAADICRGQSMRLPPRRGSARLHRVALRQRHFNLPDLEMARFERLQKLVELLPEGEAVQVTDFMLFCQVHHARLTRLVNEINNRPHAGGHPRVWDARDVACDTVELHLRINYLFDFARTGRAIRRPPFSAEEISNSVRALDLSPLFDPEAYSRMERRLLALGSTREWSD